MERVQQINSLYAEILFLLQLESRSSKRQRKLIRAEIKTRRQIIAQLKNQEITEHIEVSFSAPLA